MESPALRAAVEHSAAPANVRVSIERLAEARPELLDRMEGDDCLRRVVVAVTAASRSLTDLCVSDPAAVDVLSDLDRRSSPPPRADGLSRWKHLELLRIAARDLTGLDDLPAVGAQLARLADDVFQAAVAEVGVAGSLAVIGMGKLGGRELNYASDVDVMFVTDDVVTVERAAREIMTEVRRCYRVDANLRPEGRDGPLVRSVESYRAYWGRWAEAWEIQALLKARPVAGSASLGRAFVAGAEERLWGRPFDADALHSVRLMKARAEKELARRGLTERQMKLGRGGIRDIEFAVQILQLVHGRHDSGLRSTTTLDALAELAGGGYVDADDASHLDEAYRLLRNVEHRLQLVDELQVHTLPTDSQALDRLARVMGYRDTAEDSAEGLFLGELRHQQALVRAIHERVYFRPLLDVLVRATSPSEVSGTAIEAAMAGREMTPEAVSARLGAFGFTDAARARLAVQELTSGLTRSSRLMQQFLPVLLGWLSESPDPDMGLLGLRRLASGSRQATALAVAFRESPETARRLCLLLGTSRRLGESLEHHPDFIPALGQPEGLSVPSPAALAQGAAVALGWRQGTQDRQGALRRYRQQEEMRVAVRDVLHLETDDEDPVAAAATAMTSLAEACLEAALVSVMPPVPMSIIAMGRFGGSELSYASDLDLLLLYDGPIQAPEVEGPDIDANFEGAEAAAARLLAFMSGATPAEIVYPIDTGLRPEGKDGPLVRSLESYRRYYLRWAQPWERMALVRARPVAGDKDLGRRFMEMIDPFVWSGPLSDNETTEIRRIKARVERERVPVSEDPKFHLKLGPGALSDIEFTSQLLQRNHGVRSTATMGALAALSAGGFLSVEDHAVLAEAYRFCERTRNRWFLLNGGPGDSLPSRPEHLWRLAHSLSTSPSELRERYRKLTRRSRAVVERLFYGKPG